MHISSSAIRRIILEQSKRAGVGHIGSALSIADIIAALYGGVLRSYLKTDAGYADRDRFILSKGHAALALYAALHLAGRISDEELNTYCGDGTLLGVHPAHALDGIDFSTGSLGQGLSIGAGAALAARLQNSARRIFVLLSDAECNEGSIWEAAMFAAHHRLSNLVAIIDLNGQQAFGYTDDVLCMSNMVERWAAFKWHTQVVGGHDLGALRACLAAPGADDDMRPQMIIARTLFGKGVSFMEGKIEWHYLPMNDSEYVQAMGEVAVAEPTT